MEKMVRNVWFSRVPMGGWYRYRDVFQLMPAPPPVNPPNVLMHDYPLILDLKYDPRIWTERSSVDDTWGRDVWERTRDEQLQKVPGSEEQYEAYQEISRQRRLPAIAKELQVILSLLTNHTFLDYGQNTNSWFTTRSESCSSDPVWGRHSYPMELEDPADSFSTVSGGQVKSTSSKRYYHRITRDEIGKDMEFPDFLDELFTRYFALEPKMKQAFYRASLLWVQANDFHMPPSMSLVAEVSAIETLVHWDDPEPEQCKDCSAFLGPDTCSTCHNTKHGMRRRFRDFIMMHAGPSNKKLADRMYTSRFLVAHQ